MTSPKHGRFSRGLQNALTHRWTLPGLFILLGGALLIVYADLPIVRNAVLYGRITYAMIDFGSEFSVADHAFNKAIGYPTLSVPFVALLGANIGLKVSSFVWTSLWVVFAAYFLGRFRSEPATDASEKQLNPSLVALIFLLNPLVLYQFVSAYPDTLNALTFLIALYCIDRMTSPSGKWYAGILFAVVTLFAIWIKHHGFVILAMLPVFMVSRWRAIAREWSSQRIKLIVSALSIAVMGIVILTAQSGLIPLFNLSQNTDNYSGGFDSFDAMLARNVKNLFDYGWLSFSVLLPLLLRWPMFMKYKEWYISILVFIGTILVFHGADYNIRYYLPIAPLLAWIACKNLMALKRQYRLVWIGLFIACNLFLTAYFNIIPFNRAVREVYKLENHDNLRLVGSQYYARERIEAVNRNVREDRRTLFFVYSYYKKGMWYVWERDGLFHEDLEMIYMLKPDWKKIVRQAEQRGIGKALLFSKKRLSSKVQPAGLKLRKIRSRVYKLDFDM
ncbi:MAG: hypothetical protein QNJ97_09705 [Myxococcota bacterium]|nr:hypothetical protein [Myxococcota bacterium]